MNKLHILHTDETKHAAKSISSTFDIKSIDIDSNNFGQSELMNLIGIAGLITIEQLKSSAWIFDVIEDPRNDSMISYEDINDQFRENMGDDDYGFLVASRKLADKYSELPWITEEYLMESLNEVEFMSVKNEEDVPDLGETMFLPIQGKGYIRNQFGIVLEYLKRHGVDYLIPHVEVILENV